MFLKLNSVLLPLLANNQSDGQAMFLLVPDPSPLDPQLRGLWDWLQQRVEQCPSTLPDTVLSELVDTLLTRVQCSATSREEVIPIALALTESFMYQVRRETTAAVDRGQSKRSRLHRGFL